MRIAGSTTTTLIPSTLLLLLPLAASATIVNPSFEVSGGWTFTSVGGFNSVTTTIPVNGLPTDGSRSGRIYQLAGQDVTAGDYGSLTQVVDLTGVLSISFDAALDQFAGTEQDAWSPALEAAFRIDGVDLWTANAHGSYLNVTIDTSSLSGLHTIEFRSRAISTANLAPVSDWFLFDNVTVTVPEPGSALLLAGGLAALAASRRRRSDPALRE